MRAPLFLLFLIVNFLSLQATTIEGYVLEVDGKTPISFATVAITNTSKGVYSDENGYFLLNDLETGNYTLLVSFMGYKEKEIKNISIADNSSKSLKILLKPVAERLPEIVVIGRYNSKYSSVMSLNTLDAKAIQNAVGSANDIMQTIQSLPSMTTPLGFTNEIMVRGGASFENSYFLDGMKLPLINHFSNQGTSNGIRSIVNNAVLSQATVYSSDLPINLSSTVSGAFDFSMKTGNTQKLATKILLSTTDASIALDGPLNNFATYTLVFRQSYLKPTLKLLDRPLLASYNDWQYKIHWNIGQNNTLSFTGIGNTDKRITNEKASNTPLNQFLISSINDGKHWHVTNGFKFQNFRKNGYSTFILSTSNVFFNLYKNVDSKTNIINALVPVRNYTSREDETIAAIKNTTEWKSGAWMIGATYSNHFFSSNSNLKLGEKLSQKETTISYNSWSAYTSINNQLGNHFTCSLGFRVDGSNFGPQLKNSVSQFSPRLSLAYKVNQQFSVNAHAGIYYQLPTNVTLAHRGDLKELSNQATVNYFSARHTNLGFQWKDKSKKVEIKLEGFYKKYNNYPISFSDKVALLNKSDGFGTLGDEAILSIGLGQTYGLEFSLQRNLANGFQGNFNYTLSKSQFYDHFDEQYTASTNDARHILNFTISKTFSKNWIVGVKGRCQSALPYTPYDLNASANVENWSPISSSIKDYSLLNQQRLVANFGIDIRIDKTVSFKNSELKLYADLIDILRSRVNGIPFFNIQKDALGQPIVNPQNTKVYEYSLIQNELASFIPTVGIEVKF